MVLRNALFLSPRLPLFGDCNTFAGIDDPHRLFQDLEAAGFGLQSSINMACNAALWGSGSDSDSGSGYEHLSDPDWQNFLVLKV